MDLELGVDRLPNQQAPDSAGQAARTLDLERSFEVALLIAAEAFISAGNPVNGVPAGTRAYPLAHAALVWRPVGP